MLYVHIPDILGYLNRSVQCFQSVAIDNTPPSPSCYRLKTMLPVEHFRTHKNPYVTTYYSLPEFYYSYFFHQLILQFIFVLPILNYILNIWI